MEKEGKEQFFYSSGSLRTELCFFNGQYHGMIRLYFPKNILKRECFFQHGKRDGIDRIYFSNGKLLEEGHYSLAKPVGIHKRYNRKGALIEEIEYLDPFRFNLKRFDDDQRLCVDAKWIDETKYEERVWDRFEKVWIEKKGVLHERRLVYI